MHAFQEYLLHALITCFWMMHNVKKSVFQVTIGRSTDDTDVDIDLRKEGRANMISRLQVTQSLKILNIYIFQQWDISDMFFSVPTAMWSNHKYIKQ